MILGSVNSYFSFLLIPLLSCLQYASVSYFCLHTQRENYLNTKQAPPPKTAKKTIYIEVIVYWVGLAMAS